jgi:hypothetical protein
MLQEREKWNEKTRGKCEGKEEKEKKLENEK